MKNPNIGLVLSGGGARGAYQLGVQAAFSKFGLIDDIRAISGGSIGAFSSLLYLIKDLKTCYGIWKDMDYERVLGYKKKLTDKIPVNSKGLFNRQALLSYLYRNFDLTELLKTDIPIYACCSKIIKKGFIKKYVPEYFLLSNKPTDFIIQVILASSAIPIIFDAVQIGDNMYVDCLKTDNEPSYPLSKYELDYLFVVPLTASHDPKKYRLYDIPVIDFECDEMRDSKMINMLEFDSDRFDYYMNLGYAVGVTLLNYVSQFGAFTKVKKGMKPLPSYVSLKTANISLIPQKLLSIDEIIVDVKKGI